MPKKPKTETRKALYRPKRAKLSAEESLKRMQEFPQRKKAFIAAIRKGKRQGLLA